MAKRKLESSSSQSSPTIDQAFQRLLPRFDNKPEMARYRLNEACRSGEAEVWGIQTGKPPLRLRSDWFDTRLYIAIENGPDGWHAELKPLTDLGQDFWKTKWTVSAQESFYEEKSPSNTKRGRKEKYDWELFKAKFYLLLYDDDVPAYDSINASGPRNGGDNFPAPDSTAPR